MKPELLEVQPQELKFRFELKKQSSCSVQMINKTSHHVAFKIKTTNPKKYCVRPNAGVIDPNALCDFSVTMQAPKVAPPDMICRDKFLVQSTIVPEGTKEEDVTSSMFAKEDGKVVDEKKLKVILISPPDSPESSPIDEPLKLVDSNENRELKDDIVQQNSSHAMWKPLDQVKGKAVYIRLLVIWPLPEPCAKREPSQAPDRIFHSYILFMRLQNFESQFSLFCLVLMKPVTQPAQPTVLLPLDLCGQVVESMEVPTGDSESVEVTRKEESSKTKEAVKTIGEPVKPIQEYAKRNEEFMQMNDTEELVLAKDVEEMKSKLKELESKLTEAKATILHLTEEKRSVTQEKHFLQGELDLVRSKRHRAQAGFPLLFVFMVGLVSLYLGYLLHS